MTNGVRIFFFSREQTRTSANKRAFNTKLTAIVLYLFSSYC